MKVNADIWNVVLGRVQQVQRPGVFKEQERPAEGEGKVLEDQ